MLQEKDQEHRIQGIHVEVLNTQFLSRFKEASDDGERYPTINSVLLVPQAESALCPSEQRSDSDLHATVLIRLHFQLTARYPFRAICQEKYIQTCIVADNKA